jgi:hypothetical protein
MMSKEGGSGDDWMSKLMGKKIGDLHDETVSPLCTPSARYMMSKIKELTSM